MPEFYAAIDFKNMVKHLPAKQTDKFEEAQGHLVFDANLYKRIIGTKIVARDQYACQG